MRLVGRMRVAVVVEAAVAGGPELGIGRVVVAGGIAAAVEEDGCGLVGGEACVRGAHGGLAACCCCSCWARRSGCFALSLAVSLGY